MSGCWPLLTWGQSTQRGSTKWRIVLSTDFVWIWKEASRETLKAVLKTLSNRVVITTELRDVKEVVLHWILLREVRAITDFTTVIVLLKKVLVDVARSVIVVIGLCRTFVPFLLKWICSLLITRVKEVMSSNKVTSNEHVSLFEVIKEVLLIHPLCHPGCTVVAIASCCLASWSYVRRLLGLIVVAYRCVEVSLLTVCDLWPASVYSTQSASSPWYSIHPNTSLLNSWCSSHLRFAHVTVSLLACSYHLVIVIVDCHPNTTHWYRVLAVRSILADRRPWLNLLRRAGSATTSSDIMKTLRFLHVLKIYSGWVGRSYLFYSLAIFLL